MALLLRLSVRAQETGHQVVDLREGGPGGLRQLRISPFEGVQTLADRTVRASDHRLGRFWLRR